MAAAGITNVRIAEFAWPFMEPREGSFDFKWLEGIVGLLHALRARLARTLEMTVGWRRRPA